MSDQHSEWLNLVPHSGPFLAEPVLNEAFPQGLEKLDPIKKKILRQAYDEWREAIETEDHELVQLHKAWINYVLQVALELDGDVLKSNVHLSDSLIVELPEHSVTLKPDYALVDEQHDDKPMLLIQVYDQYVNLEETILTDGWATSPAERMAYLCKATKTRLGLVSNGEHWLLVDAPEGGVTTYASWYSRLWNQEPITLQAFVALLGVSRYFCEEERKLPYLIDESAKHQGEVTESLGEQVRRAVEVLIQALDKADLDRNRELLQDVDPQELYEAALTIMMRLVFLLSAEERDLLLLGDERYESNYAVSTLRQQLRDDAHRFSEEVLDHRYDAWSRLLSIFRAVYGGIEHETLRLPALGGSLFDPDRFPFLEGRKKGSNWQQQSATPLPIDNRTVLFLLEAIQIYRGRTLSYRALDVEQIGYVYEGLLERTAVRAKKVTLELDSTKSAKQPWVTLAELESAELDSTNTVEELLKERTGSSVGRIRNDLNKTVEESDADKLLSICRGDQDLRDRIKPYFHLLQTDRWGYPLVYPKDAFMVMTGTGRRETGTHYTPKSLTEAIVKDTLEPVVYDGPADGKSREDWQLKSPAELLDLKICDPAMGSGAFLVQVCRWLSERLMESWSNDEQHGKFIDAEGKVHDAGDGYEPLTIDAEERLVTARRLIAERCLYGVDINPLAVELAKLSIWLVTLAKGRPFGFLDHNLRSGDSLLGIHSLEQLTYFSIKPESGQYQLRMFGQDIETTVKDGIELRKQLRSIAIRDIRDIETMTRLDRLVRKKFDSIELIADAIIGEALRCGGNVRVLDTGMDALSILVGDYLNGDTKAGEKIANQARIFLSINSPSSKSPRKPFHWVLEFPEVLLGKNQGFHIIVSNPPFAGGDIITPEFKKYCKKYYNVTTSSNGDAPSTSAKVNLGTLFLERDLSLLGLNSSFGLVIPKPFLRNERYWRARQYMLQTVFPTSIIDLPADAFKSASVETCAIMGGKGWASGCELIHVIDFSSPTDVIKLDIKTVLNDERLVFRIDTSEIDVRLMDKIKKGNVPIESYFEIKVGINAGRRDFRDCFLGYKDGEMFIPNAYKQEGTNNHWLSHPEKFNKDIHKPTINGRNFTSFSKIEWDGTFLRYSQDVAYIEEFYVVGTRWSAQLREKSHYDRDVKVVSRQTAKTIIATIDTNRYFPLDTVHVYYPNDFAFKHGYDCLVLVGFLNSYVMRYYYQNLSQETGKVFPQVHISKLKTLPIPAEIDLITHDKLVKLVTSMLQTGPLPKLESQLNELVFELYDIDVKDRNHIQEVLRSQNKVRNT